MQIDYLFDFNYNMATQRLRAYNISNYLKTLDDDYEYGFCAFNDPDVKVVMKYFGGNDALARLQDSMSSSKTVFDITDDYFDREGKDYYHLMCQLADTITCSSKRLVERVRECTGQNAIYIPDPISVSETPFEHNEKPRLLWFGHKVNIFSILSLLPHLKEWPITIVTNTDKVPDYPNVTVKAWDATLMDLYLSEADIVVLPKIAFPWGDCKSLNRAADSLFAGKYVVTDSEVVYGELDPYVWIGDIVEGINFYIENPEITKTMVKAGQNYVKDRFQLKDVAPMWYDIFKELKND